MLSLCEMIIGNLILVSKAMDENKATITVLTA
jgi:hypothetical protein